MARAGSGPFARVAVAAASLALSSCACGLDTIEVEVEGAALIPGGGFVSIALSTLPPLAGLTNVNFADSKEFDDAGVDASDIDSLKLGAMLLEVTDPPGDKLDFLDSIAFYAEAPGLPRVKIAALDPIPDGQIDVDLEVSDVELKEYGVSEKLTITAEGTGRQPRFDTTIKVKATFLVDVNVSPF